MRRCSFTGGTGILITTAGNVAVEGCHVGLASDGVTVSGNTREGIRIEGTSDNQIGGSHPSSRNVVSGNGLFEFLAGAGIVIAGTTAERNAVQGNYVGTDATGALDRGNVWGILVEGGADHEVGGELEAVVAVVGCGGHPPILFHSSRSACSMPKERVQRRGTGTMQRRMRPDR